MKNRLMIAILFFTILLPVRLLGQTNAGPELTTGMVSEPHKMLARSNGAWVGQATLWFAPGKPPLVSTSVLTNHMDTSGLFQISEIKGNVTGEGRPFTGVRITGYDPERKVFTRAMLQNGSPGVVMEGVWNQATKSFTMPFQQLDASGKAKSMKEVYTFADADTEILELFDTSSGNGSEFRILKVIWRRKK